MRPLVRFCTGVIYLFDIHDSPILLRRLTSPDASRLNFHYCCHTGRPSLLADAANVRSLRITAVFHLYRTIGDVGLRFTVRVMVDSMSYAGTVRRAALERTPNLLAGKSPSV